jgi:chloramphenicol-sensitive protein RarD
VPDDATSQRRGIRVAVAAFVMWGLLTVYWKQLTAFDAVELIAWRMTCAAIVMSIVVTVRGTWPTLRGAFADRRTVVRLVVAALLLSFNWGSYVWAVLDDRVIETALGYFIAPLATMAIGVLVLKETPSVPQQIAFGLASVAVLVLTVSAGRPPWVAIAIASSWSLYALTKRRIPLDAIDGMAGETLALVVPAIAVLAVLSTRTDSVVQQAGAVDWVLVLGTGVITAVPLTLFASAAKSIPFTLLGPLNLTVPVIGFGLGWLLYSETVPLVRFVGFAFVWAALVVVMYDRIAAGRRLVADVAVEAPL